MRWTTTPRDDEEPSLKQKLHAATGDRNAEASALEDRADITEEEAQHEVRKAAGDFEEPAAPGNIARPRTPNASNATDGVLAPRISPNSSGERVTIRSYGPRIGPMKRSTTEARLHGCRLDRGSRAQHGDPDPPHTGTAGPDRGAARLRSGPESTARGAGPTRVACNRRRPRTDAGCATACAAGPAAGWSSATRATPRAPRRSTCRCARCFRTDRAFPTSALRDPGVHVRSGCLHRGLPRRESRAANPAGRSRKSSNALSASPASVIDALQPNGRRASRVLHGAPDLTRAARRLGAAHAHLPARSPHVGGDRHLRRPGGQHVLPSYAARRRRRSSSRAARSSRPATSRCSAPTRCTR